MKVSSSWLKELVDLKVNEEELIRLLPLRTIAIKDATEEFLELDMKGYNRADLLSMRGVAYEVAALTNSSLKFTEQDETKYRWVDLKLPPVNIDVQNETLCPVYCLAKIDGLKVGPSEEGWIKKLNECGVRTVNNIADVTNLVMLEYGQPLHAFDASTLANETILVRTAEKGEVITTLDNKTRKLDETDLLIADPQKALGIAGVMGGKNSEVTDQTTTILLEAAIFDPVNLRKSTTRLGLTSEASKRFYHGLTRKRLMQALNAAIGMYQKLGGKLTALTITGDMADQQKMIPLSLEKVNSLIGVDIEQNLVEEYLKKLHFNISDVVIKEGKPAWVVTPPYFRLDTEIEEDLIEEVARIYGYENIPAKVLPGEFPEKTEQSRFEFIKKLRHVLIEEGLTEIQTYSYFSTPVLIALGWDNGKLKDFEQDKNSIELVHIANPISSETEYMRTDIWPNLVEKTIENLKYLDRVAIFEIGKSYGVQNEKPFENLHLSISISNGSDHPMDELVQICKNILTKIKTDNTVLPVISDNPVKETEKVFHPIRFKKIKCLEETIGAITEVHPRVINQLGSEKRIAIAEVTLFAKISN